MLRSTGMFANDDSIHSEKNVPSIVRLVRGNMCLMGKDIDSVGNSATTDIITLHREQSRSKIREEKCIEISVNKRKERDGKHFHMTLLTKSEISQTSNCGEDEHKEKKVDQSRQFKKEYYNTFLGDKIKLGSDWYILGIGQDPSRQCFFLVVAYPRGAALRKKLGLPNKDFHVTIAFQEEDVHTCDKGVNSLLFRPSQERDKLNSSLENSISSSVELTAAAGERLLGGKPSAYASNDTKSLANKKDYQGAEILLDAAEILFEKENKYHIKGQNIGKDIIDLLVNVAQTKLVRDMSIFRCQLMGRKGEYEGMIVRTETILDVQRKLLTLQQGNTNASTAQIKEEEEESQQVEASALGYWGYALMKVKNWSDAHVYLEKSYELRNRKIKSGKASSNTMRRLKRTTLLDTKRAEESVAVERILAICCEKIGARAPLPPLTTFPRTAHLFDCGGTAMTNDDLVISGDSALFQIIGDGLTQVIIEEKIDGANMGFSLSASGDVITQNRNHYTSSADHCQFGPLTAWVAEHRSSLVKILTTLDHRQRVPSQGLILFGEWMVAKHSITYHKLPGRFVAFDLYDRLQRKFYSRSRFHKHLMGSGIPTVPVIGVQTFGPYSKSTSNGRVGKGAGDYKKVNPLEHDLRRLLETKSRFRSDGGFVEGVVLRIEEKESSSGGPSKWLQHRAKIVRPDFIRGCQDGHWMRNDIVKQRVDTLFADEYMSAADCYCLSSPTNINDTSISCNKGFRVTYKDGEVCTNEESINPRRQLLVSSDTGHHANTRLPRNFSFLWPSEVAISSTPLEQAHILAFKHAFNICLVVTLTEEEPLPSSWFQDIQGIENKFFPIPNYMPPSVEQMDGITSAVKETVKTGGSVLVHCGGGKGRAGTIAACLLLTFGFAGIRTSIMSDNGGISGEGTKTGSNIAIEHIQKTRPGSIETDFQEQFIRNYACIIWKRADQKELQTITSSVLSDSSKSGSDEAKLELKPKAASEKKEAADLKAERQRLALKTRARRRAPRCIILMGLPGSGKSTFSSCLQETLTENSKEFWTIINQDRLGRKACEKLAGSRGNSKSHRIVLDRCNIFESERSSWLEIMHSPPKGDLSLVYFAASADTCKTRVVSRKDHETIPKGRGQRIVEKMSQEIEPPTASEKKRFGSVHILETFEDAEHLLHLWGS